MASTPFKTCSNCGKSWLTRDNFLADPDIEITGFQASFTDARTGLFLFNHTARNCHTTMSTPVQIFVDLIATSTYDNILAGSSLCEHKCLSINDLTACTAPCANALLRAIAQAIVQRKPKH